MIYEGEIREERDKGGGGERGSEKTGPKIITF